MTPQSQSSSVRGGGLCVCVCVCVCGVRYVGLVTKERQLTREENVCVCVYFACMYLVSTIECTCVTYESF